MVTQDKSGRSRVASVRLTRIHWLALAGSLIVTVLAWHVSRAAQQERISGRFDREANRVIASFAEQMRRHADVLQTSASQFAARGADLSSDEWRRFHATLNPTASFPALVSLSVARFVPQGRAEAFVAQQRQRYPQFATHPRHDQPFRLPVVHSIVSDLDRALGFDLAYEPSRRDAVVRALDTASVQITEPIELTFSRTRGFLMAAPFGTHGDPDGSTDWRNGEADGFSGVVFAIVRAQQMASSLLDRNGRWVRVKIFDGAQPLYAETDPEPDEAARFSRSVETRSFGRTWRFEIESTAAFDADSLSREPMLILIVGLCIDLLMASVFVALSRSKQRAERMSRRLRRRGARLAASNETLESFAYVASHDLKMPLHGIGNLVDFIEEDLEDLPAASSLRAGMDEHVGLIRQQISRGQALIDGIMDYSVLDAEEESVSRVDVRALVQGIVACLPPGSAAPVLHGDFPELMTRQTRLAQVFTNLIGNAFKYHPDRASANVVIAAERIAGGHRFSVADDGPGIDPAHHARIFNLFETLESRPDIDSTGVGLAIVRKAVAAMGGRVDIDSTLGAGTRFTFTWPDEEQVTSCSATEAAPEQGLGRAA